MDHTEQCTCCSALFDTITKTFKIEVIRASATWSQDCCVGFLDLSKIPTLRPLDIMALNHTMRSFRPGERFRLVAFANESHGKCMGILHDRTSTESGTRPESVEPPPTSSWKRGEPRLCLYDEDTLAEVTHKATNGGFVYSVIPGSHLAKVTCEDPHSHPMFDFTEWIHELTLLGRYRIRGIWCYFNSRVHDHRFSVEIVTAREELRQLREEGGITQSSFWRRVPWNIIFSLALTVSIRLLWNALSTRFFWKES